jgi:two-component system, chemotaxis family, protein-glutamate methylesterase/glutaminase
MNEDTEDSVWSAIRALQERAVISRRIAAEERRLGYSAAGSNAETRADLDESHAADLRRLIDIQSSAAPKAG